MPYVYYKKSDAEMLNLPILLKSYIVYFFYDVEVFVRDQKRQINADLLFILQKETICSP